MKKIVSLSLAAIMLLSMVPTAFAADYTAGTKVEYTAADQTAYTITVPAQLAPGATGEVKLEGTWASDATVKVTADAEVVLTNSINAEDKHTLGITFAGIEKAGDNTQSRTYTENVSVAEMPANALFGTWSGKFNYNVEFLKEWDYSVSLEGSNHMFLEADIDDETGIVTLKGGRILLPEEIASENVSVTFEGEELELTEITEDGVWGYTFESRGVGSYNVNGTIIYKSGTNIPFTDSYEDSFGDTQYTETFLVITAK